MLSNYDLLKELLVSNTKLNQELTDLVKQVEDQCTEAQIQSIQTSLIANINHNAILVATRQLGLLENVATQLNLLATKMETEKDKAMLMTLASNLDKALVPLKTVNNK